MPPSRRQHSVTNITSGIYGILFVEVLPKQHLFPGIYLVPVFPMVIPLQSSSPFFLNRCRPSGIFRSDFGAFSSYTPFFSHSSGPSSSFLRVTDRRFVSILPLFCAKSPFEEVLPPRFVADLGEIDFSFKAISFLKERSLHAQSFLFYFPFIPLLKEPIVPLKFPPCYPTFPSKFAPPP